METNLDGFSLERSTDMVLRLKGSIGKSLIQLGKHIEIVKENLPSKDYLDWLKYEVKIHRATAHRYMRIAREVDPVTLERLGTSKVYDILESPISDEEKKGLMERGAELNRDQIRAITDVPTTKPSNPEAVESAVEASELDADVEKIIDGGIDFVERVEQINISQLNDNWRKFVISQIRIIAKELTEYVSKFV